MPTFKLRNCVESFVPSYVMHVFTLDGMVLFYQALTLRPLVSNVKTATYNTGQYLANVLALLGKSDYTIINTTDFIHRLKKERIPRKYKMKLFDIQSLFTNVALDDTISIILTKIYDEGKIEKNIPRNVMKELLLLCTKHVHFTFNGDIYIQLDGVTMGSPLEPLLANLANVFMRSVEESKLPTLKYCLLHWKKKMTRMRISSQARYIRS